MASAKSQITSRMKKASKMKNVHQTSLGKKMDKSKDALGAGYRVKAKGKTKAHMATIGEMAKAAIFGSLKQVGIYKEVRKNRAD